MRTNGEGLHAGMMASFIALEPEIAKSQQTVNDTNDDEPQDKKKKKTPNPCLPNIHTWRYQKKKKKFR